MAGAGEAIKSIGGKEVNSATAKGAGALLSKDAGNVAGAAGSAGSAVQGVALGAGVAAGRSVVNAISDPGFVLFLAGIFTFFINELLSNALIAIFLASVFMFFATIFILKGRGLVVVSIFWVWYVFLGGNTDPETLLYSMAPILFVGMVAHGIYQKLSKKGTFVEGSAGELIGLLPIVLFFLDLGLIALLTQTFALPISGLAENLILFTPWWAIFGIFSTKKSNMIITVFKFLAIIWVFSLLSFGVAPGILDKQKSLVPGAEDFLKAKQEVKESLPDKENPAYSNFICILSEPTNVPGCVEKRKQEAKLEAICLAEEDDRPLEDCMEEQRKKKADATLQVAGIVDTTIKLPTKAELVVDKSLFPTDYNPQGAYPVELNIENPRKEKFSVEVSCNFSGKGVKDVAGEITNNKIEITEDFFESTLLCTPTSKLKGGYEIQFIAEFINLKTRSRLQRAFIGTKTPKEKEKLRNEEISRVIPIAVSQAPKEFARIDFDLGHAAKEIIIEDNKYKNIVLRSKIENTGAGVISNVKQYTIYIDGANNKYCVEGPQSKLKQKTSREREIPLPSCTVEYPVEYKGIEDWVQKEFEAELVYDYQIVKKETINVKGDESGIV